MTNVVLALLGMVAIALSALYSLLILKRYIDDKVTKLAIKSQILLVCLYCANKKEVYETLFHWKERLNDKAKTAPLTGLELEFYSCVSEFLTLAVEPTGQKSVPVQEMSFGNSDEQSFSE